MKIETLTSGPLATNTYLLLCEQTKEGALIDAAPGVASAAIEAAKGFLINKILITHSHWDHIADCKRVADAFSAPIYVHAEDVENLRHPGTDRLPYFLEQPIEGVETVELIRDGDRIKVGSLELEVLHTPGHCPGLVSFYLEPEKVLFCGDLFFKGAIGSLALPTAQAERMWPSLKRVSELPDDTMVYPGHGESTTIGQESWLKRAKEIYGGR